jgi:hypothetical protein
MMHGQTQIKFAGFVSTFSLKPYSMRHNETFREVISSRIIQSHRKIDRAEDKKNVSLF